MLKTEQEIWDALDKHMDNAAFIRSKWSGMTYLQGVEATLRWVLGEQDDTDFLGELPDQGGGK